MFDMTVAENISFGCPNATQEEVEEAAKEANAHDFIVKFPDGYNTQMGEGGTQVSGGKLSWHGKGSQESTGLSPCTFYVMKGKNNGRFREREL